MRIGGLTGYALYTPGHVPACMTYVFGHSALFGDTLFMPEGSTARVDFPGCDPTTLFESIQNLFGLKRAMHVHVCHDHSANGKEIQYRSPIAEQRIDNIHVNKEVITSSFLAMRTERYSVLGVPALIPPSLQVNIRAGKLPALESSGLVYLKEAINVLQGKVLSP